MLTVLQLVSLIIDTIQPVTLYQPEIVPPESVTMTDTILSLLMASQKILLVLELYIQFREDTSHLPMWCLQNSAAGDLPTTAELNLIW